MGLGIKLIFINTSLLLVGFLLSGFCKAPSDILALHKAGEVVIGMTVDEVYGVIGKQNTALVDLYLEATYSPALIVNYNGARSVIFEIASDKIWRVTVFDPKYKTTNGIGVGSVFGTLKEHYTISSIETGEGNVCAYVKELEMSFCLNYRKEINGDLKSNQIPKDTRITKIFVL